MNQDEREKKREVFNKIMQLVKTAETLADTTEDEQTMFLSESLRLVLIAGSDPDSARLLSEHLIHYIEELEMLKGETQAVDFLKEKQLIPN